MAITLDEARAATHAGVVYRPEHGDPEWGQIAGVSAASVFVRYGRDVHAKATRPEDLAFRPCGDCAAERGTPHVDGCDVAQCTVCGGQRISCEHGDADVGWGQVWTGVWPGEAECREWGWFSRWVDGSGWVECGPDDPGAGPDLNRLRHARWDEPTQRYVRREL